MNKTKKKYVVEDLFSGANKALEDIDVADSFIKDLPSLAVESLNTEIRQKSLESVIQNVDPPTPAYTEVSISDDEMEAVADFFPPSEGSEPLKPEEVSKVLGDNGIIQGIDWDVIRDAVFKCNTGFEPVTGVVVATGSLPVDEIPEHLETEPGLVTKENDLENKKTRIDFKNISPFVLVKKGDTLARTVPVRPGKRGSR